MIKSGRAACYCQQLPHPNQIRSLFPLICTLWCYKFLIILRMFYIYFLGLVCIAKPNKWSTYILLLFVEMRTSFIYTCIIYLYCILCIHYFSAFTDYAGLNPSVAIRRVATALGTGITTALFNFLYDSKYECCISLYENDVKHEEKCYQSRYYYFVPDTTAWQVANEVGEPSQLQLVKGPAPS